MNRLTEIILSYANSYNPSKEMKKIAEKRLGFCVECDKWVQGVYRDYCSVCGCNTSAKVFSPKGADACPENKWLE